MPRLKQVILIRRDLKMRRGKEIAQGSHAAMEFLLAQIRQGLTDSGRAELHLSSVEKQWISIGMAKVCLQVKSETELLAHHESALQHGLKSYLISQP